MNWYLKVLKNYAEFSGRARRKEFWMFALFNIGISVILSIIDAITTAAVGIGVLSGLYGLAVLIPSLAVSIRRLHDTDRSGFWLLIWFIPVIGWIILLVFSLQEGTRGANRFGNDPKNEADPI